MNDVVDEINALRNDFYEDGGIVDELVKIRKLLENINLILTKALILTDGSEFEKHQKKLNETIHENK